MEFVGIKVIAIIFYEMVVVEDGCGFEIFLGLCIYQLFRSFFFFPFVQTTGSFESTTPTGPSSHGIVGWMDSDSGRWMAWDGGAV